MTMRVFSQHGDRDDGFTLIEVVLAMVILGIVSTAILALVLSAQAQSVVNRNRVAAANLAARELDLVRDQFTASSSGPTDIVAAGKVTNPHPLTGGITGSPLVVDGTQYTVVRNVHWDTVGTGKSSCEGGTKVQYPTMTVTVTVTWPHMGVVKPVVSSAMLSPSKKTGLDDSSTVIAAKVVDQNAHPVEGVRLGANSYSGATDADGCAVIDVSAAASGTAFTLKVLDDDYVDMSGTTKPSKDIGILKPGDFYSNANFTVARPGSVTVRLVDTKGDLVPDDQAAGAQVTLVASEYSGGSGATVRTLTGGKTTFTGLWPTTYGAYFGTQAPPSFTTALLDAGGTVTLDVSFELAEVALSDMPVGTTKVVLVPAGTPDVQCAAGEGTRVAVAGTSDAIAVLPGTYDLYVIGDTFGCSPGPTGVTLTSGDDNEEVAWGSTTISLTAVPTTSGSKVWAVEKIKSGLSSLSTCPSSVDSIAVDIDDARSGKVSLPAGTWYVYLTDGSATGTCLSYPDLISPLIVVYDHANTATWNASPLTTTLTMKSISPTSNYFIVTTSSAAPTCKSTVTSNGDVYQSSSAGSSQTLNMAVPRPTTGQITYYAYLWTKGTRGSCASAGKYYVGPTTSTLTKDASNSTAGPGNS